MSHVVVLRSADDMNNSGTPSKFEIDFPHVDCDHPGPFRVQVHASLVTATATVAQELQLRCNAITNHFTTDAGYDGWATVIVYRGYDTPQDGVCMFARLPERIGVRMLTTTNLAQPGNLPNAVRLTLTPM
jgi:hypothetical protein